VPTVSASQIFPIFRLVITGPSDIA
jgi:hypothetical protein